MADQKVSNLPALNGADVDSADLLYIVDSSAGTAGSKKITIGQYQLAPVSGGTANGVTYLNGSKVQTSGSALTFDGTNLGIGTSSPLFKLDARGASGAGISYIETTTGNTNRIQLGATAGLGYINATAGTGSPSLQFQVADAEKMRLDASGNLGLGVTPSAWSVIKAIEIGSFRNSIFSDNGSVSVGIVSGSYYNAGWKYAVTGSAVGYYEVAGNAHRWFSAPSGTAGNAISFTQAMTLDASGNLGVGVTSISGFRLDVLSTSTDAAIRARSSNSNEVLRVESTGTATSSIRFINTSVNNTYISADGTALTFLTAATERARITSGGDLCVGRTAAISSERLCVEKDLSSAYVVRFRNTSSTTPFGLFITYPAAAPNGADNLFLRCDDSAATRFELRSNGGLANYSANNANLSDVRTKTDIQPAGSYLDKICAIPVKTFLYKDQTDTERNLGVIAQDVDAVAPELIDHSGFGETPEGESPLLAVYQTDLQYALMKCIQEQQELITDLRARVAALEAK